MFPGSALSCRVFLLLAAAVAADSQDDMFTCGGFIRSSMPIPFEKIKVKLLTTAGNLKAETEGTANSGYYLLPVYDKGKYQLRVEGPDGWAFQPPAVDIDLNGQDPCSQGRDINFEFRGFSVMGKVISKGSTNGPAGVEVTLVDAGSTRTVKTLNGGNFVFPAVSPGVYKIKFRGEVAEAKVEKDNVRLGDSLFVIEGYSLKGKVRWDLPQASATLVLANEESVACCGRNPSKELPKGFVLPAKYRVACVIKSGSDGAYEFPCVKAASKYAVFAHVLTQSGQVVDISPSRLELDLAHSDAVLDSFEVTGFPVMGVVREAGGNVEVKLVETGFETVTDKDGVFKLGSLRAGRYTLQLRKSGLEFANKQIVVDPARATLADIFPDRFEVCGDVRVTDSVDIEITNVRTQQVVKARSDVSSGRFCAFVERGEHVIRPKHSVRLSPWEVKAKVPLADGQRLVFLQFAAMLKGRVACLGGVCAGVKVALNGATASSGSAGTGAVAKAVANSDGTFVFKNVDPGTYEVCVTHSRSCFEKDCQPITVIDHNIDDIRFVQKGYTLRLESSHETELEVGGAVIKVKPGLSTHCVTETKPIPIRSVGCHRFANEDRLAFSPNDDGPLVLNAESHRLGVEINSKLLVEDLRLTCRKGDDATAAATAAATDAALATDAAGAASANSDDGVHVVHLKEYKKSGDTYIYLTELYYPKGAELVLEPHSDSLTFKPPQLTMRMPDDCIAIAISGRTGLFIEGAVRPPLAGVEITVSTKENPRPCRTLTDAAGKYRAGPLESQAYTIAAHKEGYGFERIADSNDLAAVKYSRIDIRVVDESTNAPLAGALVSIAGGVDYRNTTKTGPRGELALIKLNPGEYYVRVMMKEYRFEPTSTMVSVSENSEELLLIRGKKVAYSVMGRVTSITGELEAGVTLEAISDECDRHEEDATSDEAGNFRIRGLREACTYEIRLKRIKDGVESKFERTLPTTQRVAVERSDVTLNMVAIRPIRSTTLSVAVRAEPPLLLPTLRVVLWNRNRQLYSVPAARFVTFPNDLPLDGSTYQVELQQHNAKLPPHLQVVLLNDVGNATESGATTVFADRSYHHLEIEVRLDEKAAAGHGQTPAPASPFVAVLSVFVALAVFYRKEIGNLLRHRQDNSPAAGDRRKNRSR